MIGSLRGSTEAAIHQVSMYYGSSRACIFPVVFATSYIIKLAWHTPTDNLIVFHLDFCCQIIKEREKKRQAVKQMRCRGKKGEEIYWYITFIEKIKQHHYSAASLPYFRLLWVWLNPTEEHSVSGKVKYCQVPTLNGKKKNLTDGTQK